MTNIDPTEPLAATLNPIEFKVEIALDDHLCKRDFKNGLGRYTRRRSGWIY